MAVNFSTEENQILYENRYCNQEGFSILICGGKGINENYLNRVLEMKVPSFEITEFPSMVIPNYRYHLVTNNSDIIAIDTELDESLENAIKSVEIFSDKYKTWNHQCVQPEQRYDYCICSFI